MYVRAVWVRGGASHCLNLSEALLLQNACQLSCNTRCEAALACFNTVFPRICGVSKTLNLRERHPASEPPPASVLPANSRDYRGGPDARRGESLRGIRPTLNVENVVNVSKI